jgi:hypothetical protein
VCFCADDDAGAGSSSSDTCHLGATAAQPTTPEKQQQQQQCCIRCLPLQQRSVLLSAAFLLAGKPSLTARQLAQACQQLRPVAAAAAAVGPADGAAVGSSATAAAWCEQHLQQQQHLQHVEMLEKVHKRHIVAQDLQQQSNQPAASSAAAAAVNPRDDASVLSILPQPLALHDMLGQLMQPNSAAAAASPSAADVANLLHLLGSADLSAAESAVTACLQGQQQLLLQQQQQQQPGVPARETAALTTNSSSSNGASSSSSCSVCGWRPVFARVASDAANAEHVAVGGAWVMLPSSAASGTGELTGHGVARYA